MKRYMMTLVALFAWMGISAMDYETARERAYYLTDKMAYELNLNDQQYNDAYEINLDYLLSINTEADLADARYLAYRNNDLRHILYDWQWTAFAAVDYLFRPLWWLNGGWHFPVYNYYAHSYYFYHHPRIYWDYRGGHGRYYYSSGYYYNRRPVWHGGLRGMHHSMIGHPNPGHGPYGGGVGHRRGVEHRGGGYHFERGHNGPGNGHNGYRPEGGRNNNGGRDGYRPEGGHNNNGSHQGYRPEGGHNNGGSHQGNYGNSHSSRPEDNHSRPQGSTSSSRGEAYSHSSSRATVGSYGTTSSRSGSVSRGASVSRGGSVSRGSSTSSTRGSFGSSSPSRMSSGSSSSGNHSRGGSSNNGGSRGSRGGGRH